MDLRLKTCCVIVVAFSVVRACRLNDNPTLNNVSERLVNNTAVEDFLNDYQLNSGWYRVTNNGRLYTLADISSNLSYGICGTFYPIFLKDEHPHLSSIHFDYTDVKACVYDDNAACSIEYNLRMRRCGPDLEYYLQSALPYSAYCLVPQCEQGFYGSDCQHACQCKAPGTHYCFPDTGECECNTGFNGPLCENDVDECVTGMHNCSRDMVCYNTLGSYKCMCRDGWTFDNASDTCILPVRACRLNDNPTLNNVSERLVNNTAVEDFLNDVQLNAGWYHVTRNGRLYTLADVSSNVSNGMCGTFYPIFLKDVHPNLSSIHFDYTDVKACVYDDNAACSIEYNLRMRRCGPDLEYYLQSALPYSAYCLVPQCEQGFYGSDCQHACQCKAPGTHYCFPDTGECECNTGFNGPLCENDVDECVTGMHNCSRDMVCYNTLGSYKCMCRDGWTFDNASDTCILPVRACRLNDNPTLNNVSERLVNNTAVENFLNDVQLNAGWYRVTRNGRLYTLADVSSNVSNGMCGTFYPIFLKDEHPHLSSIHFDYTDVKACVYDDNAACSIEFNLRMRRCGPDLEYFLQSALPYSAYCLVPQCEQGFYGSDCQHACKCKAPGTYFCFPDTGECECRTGFYGPFCENDVDECVTGMNNCSRDMICNNTLGSYDCMCRVGLSFDNASDKCILPECVDDSYGNGCTLRCQCNREHSFQYKVNQWCNPQLGHCTCKQGWAGFTCDADIDECKDDGFCNTDVSVCKNFPGTFSCECKEGYANEGGKCISDPTTNYTAVIISVSVVLVAILVIAASIALWKCKGIKLTRCRTAPDKYTGSADSSIDTHSNDYSCIDDIGTLRTASDHVYERYTQPAEKTRMDASKDIVIVRDNFCASSYFNHSNQSQRPDEHVYLSLQANKK